ncbi:MAG: hypothetical protein WCP35_07490 [Verrucomicrobiota bacterium]
MSIRSKLSRSLAALSARMDTKEEIAHRLTIERVISPGNFAMIEGEWFITLNGAWEYFKAVLDKRVAGDVREARHYLDKLNLRVHWQQDFQQREENLRLYASILADITPGDKKVAIMALRYMITDFPFDESDEEPEAEPEPEPEAVEEDALEDDEESHFWPGVTFDSLVQSAFVFAGCKDGDADAARMEIRRIYDSRHSSKAPTNPN